VTTTFFLVRHAAHELVDRVLCGRMPGVRLGESGREQARRVAARLERERIAAIHTSPLERARETAAPIAERFALAPEVCDDLNELDVGEWSGREFSTLRADPRWTTWNEERGGARVPGGETMRDAQARIVGHMERMRGPYRDKAVVLVSHADMIKAALLHCLNMPLDGYRLFEISPGSVTTLVIGDWGAKILCMNEVPA
jgi:probable phosphoglycerate mutase